MKKTYLWWRWMIIPLFALTFSMILGLLSSYTRSEKERLYLTPIFDDLKGWDIYTLDGKDHTELTPRELVNVEAGKTFYISRTLTTEWQDSDFSFLLLDSQRPASVFLDNELIYTTCPEVEKNITEITFPNDYKGLPQRGESIRFSIPMDSVGKVLTIATTHPASQYSSGMPSVQLSSEATESESWMKIANHNSMPAAAFATAALLLLGLLSYSLFSGNRDLSLLLLTATAMCQLFNCLRDYSFSSPGLTALDTPFAAFLPMLAVILPEIYLLIQMKRRKKICAVFILISAALSFIPPVANLFGTVTFKTYPFLEALYIGLFAILIFAVLEARDKNKEFKLFLFGLGIICFFVVIGYVISQIRNPYFANYITFLLRGVSSHDPSMFLYWCGIVLFCLASATSIYILIRNTANTQTELAVQSERYSRLNYELVIQKQIYEVNLSTEEEVRSLHHDMKSHLSTISELLKDRKVEEAIAYLAELTDQHKEHQREVFCSNTYINAVLRTFSLRIKERNIAFECHVGVDNEVLPGVELCLILSNALENALEASLSQPESERLIKVQARVFNGQFLLRVSNRFNGTLQEKNDLPVSTKEESGHGYGMMNIRSTTKRLGGEMNYQIEDGIFMLDVRFPVQ